VFICVVRFHENGLAFLIHALGCCTVFMVAALHNLLLYYGEQSSRGKEEGRA
jgi:hypothetical protein